MSTREQFLPNTLSIPPKSINLTSTAIQTTTNANPWLYYMNSAIPNVLSGACAAGVAKTIVSITGGGVLNFLALHNLNSSGVDETLKITIDGVVIATHALSCNAFNGMVTVGAVALSGVTTTAVDSVSPILEDIPFSKSLLIGYTSGSTLTDKARIYYKYRTI